MEVLQNGSSPKWKFSKMEVLQSGSFPIWKFSKIEVLRAKKISFTGGSPIRKFSKISLITNPNLEEASIQYECLSRIMLNLTKKCRNTILFS